MAKRVSRSNSHLSCDAINTIYVERKKALKYYIVSTSGDFTGFSAKEIREKLSDHLVEAEYDGCLALLAAIEAMFRLDFDYCVRNRPKNNSRTRKIRELDKQHERQSKIKIDEFFDYLADEGCISKSTAGNLKNCFKYRNWLAHGRYWTLKLGRKTPAFGDIYQIAKEVEKHLYK